MFRNEYIKLAEVFRSDEFSVLDVADSREFVLPIAAIIDTQALLRSETVSDTVENYRASTPLRDGQTLALDFNKVAFPFDRCIVSLIDSDGKKATAGYNLSAGYNLCITGILFDFPKQKCVATAYITANDAKDIQPVLSVIEGGTHSLCIPTFSQNSYLTRLLEKATEDERTALQTETIMTACEFLFVITNLDLFGSQNEYTETQTIRAGTHKKRQDFINKVVILKAPKTVDQQELSRRRVEFSHRFEVRGHWRKVKKYGYDQNGDLIFGKTWVRPCVKGPKDKPLIRKTRVITQ